MQNLSFEKIQKMNEAELREIINSGSEVRFGFKNAAKNELESRGLQLNFEEKLKISESQKSLFNDENSNKKYVFYSKQAIFLVTVFCGPLIGAFFLMSNVNQVNKNQKIASMFIFAILYNMFVLNSLIRVGENYFWLPILGGMLAGYILIRNFWSKYITDEIEYEKKSNLIPSILVGVGILLNIYLNFFIN